MKNKSKTNPVLQTALARPLVYRAVIAQYDAQIPYEAFVFENTLGATISFERMNESGVYRLNASQPVFPSAAKVFILTSLYNDGETDKNICLTKFRRWDADSLAWFSYAQNPDTGIFELSDGCAFFLEVTVYP